MGPSSCHFLGKDNEYALGYTRLLIEAGRERGLLDNRMGMCWPGQTTILSTRGHLKRDGRGEMSQV